jgi:rhamnogalacturonyl hydrolase YesR
MWDRQDISYPVIEWILQYQDPVSGGIFNVLDEPKNRSGIIEFEATALSGIALLSMGRRAEAKRVGDYLILLHKEQPDLERRYLFDWETGKGVIDSYDEDQALFFVAVKGKEKQAYWKNSMAIAFLSKLFLATRELQYLNLAKDHFHFLEEFGDVFRSVGSHKLCWASTTLYQATGETKFLEAAKRVGDFLIGLQNEDGTFNNTASAGRSQEDWLVSNLEIVSQFTTWIAFARWYLPDLYS